MLRAATSAAASDQSNLLTIGLVVVFAVLIFFMFRNSRKRRRDQEAMQEKFVPGTEVMTSHGIFGTIISIDEEKNEAIIETTPGTRLRLHRQTLSRVVEPTPDSTEVDDIVVPDDASSLTDGVDGANSTDAKPTTAPEYGERVDPDAGDDATRDDKPKD